MLISFICIQCGCGIDSIDISEYCNREKCVNDDSDSWAMSSYKKRKYNKIIYGIKKYLKISE